MRYTGARAPERHVAVKRRSTRYTSVPERDAGWPPVALLHYDDGLRLLPEPFQTVKIPLLRRKHMHDDVAEIEQHPAGFGRAFDAGLACSRSDQFFIQRIDDRAQLSFVLRRANHEVVGNRRQGAQIEHDDIVGLLVLGKRDRATSKCCGFDNQILLSLYI